MSTPNEAHTRSDSAAAEFPVRPEDFADPRALNVGPFSQMGSIGTACEMALGMVEAGQPFGVDAVQFYFNGTPGVARSGQDVMDVFRDWDGRRTAYQKAAGILPA